MAFETDATNWSGDGDFTLRLLDRLRGVNGIRLVRVEDAPASRAEEAYQFLSNELFVEFEMVERREPVRRLGIFPGTRTVAAKAMTLNDLENALAAIPDIGEADYADDGMLQYLRAERVIPPYQTRGYKMVELVRIYEVGAPRRS